MILGEQVISVYSNIERTTDYNAFNVYCRELAPGTVSLTGGRAQGDDNKHCAYSTAYVVNSHFLPTVPVYKKNRIAPLLCIFETTIVVYLRNNAHSTVAYIMTNS